MSDVNDKESSIKKILNSTNESNDVYEKYAALLENYTILKKLADETLKESDELMKYMVKHPHEKSSKYEVVVPTVNKRKVNVAKLKENPELFNKYAFVDDAFATKIIGRPIIRELFCEKFDGTPDELIHFMTANITELEKDLGKMEASQYIEIEEKRGDHPIFVEKGTYPADYYGLNDSEVTHVFIQNIEGKVPKPISKVKL